MEFKYLVNGFYRLWIRRASSAAAPQGCGTTSFAATDFYQARTVALDSCLKSAIRTCSLPADRKPIERAGKQLFTKLNSAVGWLVGDMMLSLTGFTL
jgi:hypothetical protein